jgi:O-antigen/teichoic acid export membrane protein
MATVRSVVQRRLHTPPIATSNAKSGWRNTTDDIAASPPLRRDHSADASVLAQGAGIALVGRGIGRGLSVLVQAAVARGLGPVAYGLYGIGWTILRIGVSLASFGLGHGVVRYGSHHNREGSGRLRDVLIQGVGLALVTSAIVAALVFLSANWLAVVVFGKPDLANVIRWFAPGLAFASGLQVAASATRISKRIQFAAVSQEIFQPLANLVLVLVVLWLGWGLAGAVGAAVASFALAMGLALAFVIRLYRSAFASTERPQSVAGELLSFSGPAALSGVFTTLLILVDRLIVGHYRPAAEVGVYQAASTVSSLFPVVLTAFSSILGPMVAELHHSGEKARFREVYLVGTKWGIYVSLPVFLLVLFFPGQLMELVFGERFFSGGVILIILSVGQLINVGTGSINTVLLMSGLQLRWLLISGIGLAADIGLGLLLTAKYGVVGAAMATAVAGGGMWLVALLYGKRLLDLWPYDRRTLKPLAAAVVVAAGLALLRAELQASLIVTVIAAAGTAGVAFYGMLIILGIDREDSEVLRYIGRRLGLR